MAVAVAMSALAPQTWLYLRSRSSFERDPVNSDAHRPSSTLAPLVSDSTLGVAVPQQCPAPVHVITAEHFWPGAPIAGDHSSEAFSTNSKVFASLTVGMVSSKVALS